MRYYDICQQKQARHKIASCLFFNLSPTQTVLFVHYCMHRAFADAERFGGLAHGRAGFGDIPPEQHRPPDHFFVHTQPPYGLVQCMPKLPILDRFVNFFKFENFYIEKWSLI